MESGEPRPETGASPAEGQAQPAGDADAFAALTARVLALEHEVAALRTAGSRLPTAQRPASLAQPAALPALMPIRIPIPPPPPPLAPAAPARSLEERFGSQFFNMIGIVAIFIAAALALKLAVDKGLIGPVARVLIGLAAGCGIVLWSETFRRKGLQVFSWSLKAIGSGILYLSLWAAFQLFHLLPAWAALAAMVLVTAWNAFMAWSQDAELLAAYALAGGFLTPLLLSTGGDHEIFLFTYLAALDLGLVLLIRFKPWARLLLPAFAATAFFYFTWFESNFRHVAVESPLFPVSPTGLVIPNPNFWPTIVFVVLFFAIFATVSMRISLASVPQHNVMDEGSVVPVLLPLANASFLAVALTLIVEDSARHGALAWVMVGLAALFLLLVRLQRSPIASAVHLACAVVFLTIALPLKATGHSLTIAWLVEGLILLWVSTRFADSEPGREPGPPARAASSVRVLRVLAVAGYLLGLGALTIRLLADQGQQLASFNPDLWSDLGSALVAAAALAGAVWLGLRARVAAWVFAALLALGLVGILLAVPELLHVLSSTGLTPFANPPFLFALVGLALLAASAWSAARIAASAAARGTDADLAEGRVLALALGVVANLLAIFSFVRQIDGLFRADPTLADAELERSLAVSGFLMLYAAALLTAGFVRRSALTRWQALILLLFTILKVFLYDLSVLSQGYRIASIFALGALLMAVSLAYQRDWLGLRAARPASNPEADPEEDV